MACNSNYYTMRDAKVKIAHELMNRGWKVEGYHADESDFMTDYYSPAYWNGIATKNGFVLVVDNSYAAERTEIKKYNYSNSLSHADQEKINKLSNLTQDRGATAGEEANAKALIEKIKSSKNDTPEFEIVGYTTAHMANPGRCKWHIERDGSLFDKGTGITKYSDVPDEWEFDINTMQFKEYHDTWSDGTKKELTDEQLKAVKELKALILRWERIVNNMNTMGDGTKETEEAGKEQQSNEILEKVIVKEVKKVTKPIAVNRKSVKVGDYLKVRNYSCYWVVTDVNEERKTFTYAQVGKKYQELRTGKRYYDYFKSLDKDGYYIINELKEVEEVTEIEKWVRKSNSTSSTKKATNKKDSVKTESNNNETSKTQNIEVDHNTDLVVITTITLNDSKNGIEIRFSSKPDSEIRSSMKSNGFRWGGINNNCWYAKQSEDTINFTNELINKINNNSNENELHTEENINNNDTNTDTIEINPVEDVEIINNITVENMEEVATDTTTATNNNPYEHESIEEGFLGYMFFMVI